jgi:transcriptional regulator with XRE-family HTH domain
MPYLTPETRAIRERLRREFSSRLNEAMARAGLTQKELVELTGIPQANLSGMMNGRLGASAPRLAALAQALGIEPYDLMPQLGPGEVVLPVKSGSAKPLDKDTHLPSQAGSAPDLLRPPGGGVARPSAGQRSTRSAGLEQHLQKFQTTTTVEIERLLEEMDGRWASVPKDPEFWAGLQQFLEGQLARRAEQPRHEAQGAAATPASEGERHGRPKASAATGSSSGRRRSSAP